MEKVEKYRRIIKTELDRQIEHKSSIQPGIQKKLIISPDGLDFIFLVFGWHNKSYQHFIAYRVELKDGKVWVHEDRTDSPIADRLTELGIPASDIICTYLEPKYQEQELAMA